MVFVVVVVVVVSDGVVEVDVVVVVVVDVVIVVVDPAALSAFDVIQVLDPSQLGNALSRASGPPFNDSGLRRVTPAMRRGLIVRARVTEEMQREFRTVHLGKGASEQPETLRINPT